MQTVELAVDALEVKNASVTLIGAVDSFTISTMLASDASRDILTSYTDRQQSRLVRESAQTGADRERP